MEVQIDKEKETPLLSRKRVTAWVYYDGSTPSRNETLKEFAKKMKVKPEKVVIKHMYTRFGQQYLKLIANVYNDTETLKKLESENLIEKHKQAWEKKDEQKEEKSNDEQEEIKEETTAENKQEENENKPKEQEEPESDQEQKEETNEENKEE